MNPTFRLVVTGLLCWALAGTAYAVLRLTFGDRPVYIHVRWAPNIGDTPRLQLEQRYQLARAEPRGNRTFGYALTDRSRDNIRNLVLDPAVEDTHEIHRTAFRVGYFAPRLEYVTPSPGIPVGLEFPVDPWFPDRACQHQPGASRANRAWSSGKSGGHNCPTPDPSTVAESTASRASRTGSRETSDCLGCPTSDHATGAESSARHDRDRGLLPRCEDDGGKGRRVCPLRPDRALRCG